MNRDDIIRMALEAGTPITPEMKSEDALAIAFALGKAEEREACLKICSEIKKNVTAKTNAGTILSHVIYHIKQREKKVEA